MIISEAKYEVCGECGRRIQVSDRKCGCDACGKELLHSRADYLQCTVFPLADTGNEHYEFCCWRCFWQKLPELETDGFIDFPYLQFSDQSAGLTVADFWRAVVEIGAVRP